MDTRIFEEFGLSPAEIKVYLTLLELGNSGAKDITKNAKLHNSVVYRALDSLVEKGLISYVLKGKRKEYQSVRPEHFLNFIDEKKEKFERMLPELKKLKASSPKETSASIYKEIRGLKEVYSLMISQEGETYLTFGGGEECENLLGEVWWTNHHIKRIDSEMPARQIYDETVRELGDELNKKELTHIKFLPEDMAQYQETVIVGEYVAINVFTKRPYSFLIKDEHVAEGYKKQFETLWKIAHD